MKRKHYLHKYMRWSLRQKESLLPVLVIAVFALGAIASVLHSAPFGNSPEAKFTDTLRAGLAIVPASGGSVPVTQPISQTGNPPSPVSNLSVSCDNNTASYSWSPVAGATSYIFNVQDLFPTTRYTWPPQTLSSTFYTMSGLYSESYAWSVEACNSAGCSSSVAGNNFSCVAPPPPPTSLSASCTDHIASYSWNPVSGATSYIFNVQDLFPTTRYTWPPQTLSSTFYTMSGLYSESYAWSVEACNSAGCSTSASGNPFSCVAPPNSPATASASCDNNTASYSWSPVAGATSYAFWQQDTQTSYLWNYSLSSPNYSMSGLYGPSYDWSVEACNSAGCGTSIIGNRFSCGNSKGPFCPIGETGVYPNCSTTDCMIGYASQGGECVFTGCPVGFTASHGECVFTGCPLGYTSQGGECVFTGCPLGWSENSIGECVPPGQKSCTPHNICGIDGNLYHEDASCNTSATMVQNCNDYGCTGNSCNAPPAPTVVNFSVNPVLVQSGETTQVSWEVEDVSGCGVTGSNGDGASGAWTGPSGTETSSAIKAQTIYTLDCSIIPGAENADGSPASPVHETATVNIVPTFNEQ